MAWIREKGESKSYLVVKKLEKQWFSGGCKLKQMKLVVDVDVFLKKSSSARPGNVQIDFHH
jgi:hypothetical protein